MTKQRRQDTSEQGTHAPSTHRSNSDYWMGLWILILSLLSGSAFWWVPLIWPQISVQHSFAKRVAVLESIEKEQPAVLPEDLKKLALSIATDIEGLRAQVKSQQPPQIVNNTSPQNIPLVLVFMDLKLKVQLGEPFVRELAQLKKLTKEDLSPLDDHAQLGIPSLPLLSQEFKIAAQEIAILIEDQQAQTSWEKSKILLKKLIKIEKSSPPENVSSESTGLHSLYPSIKQGNVSFVLEQLKERQLPKSDKLETWRTYAERYVSVMGTLEKLTQKLFVDESK